MRFVNEQHKNNFKKLLELDNNIFTSDKSLALFYLVAGDKELYDNVECFYDFEKHILTGNTPSLSSVYTLHLFHFMRAIVADYWPVELNLLGDFNATHYDLILRAIDIRFGRIKIEDIGNKSYLESNLKVAQ